MADFTFLRHWIMGSPGQDASRHEPRPVILECIPSRSGMSLTVYDRDNAIFRVPGAAFGGGLNAALDHFLESCFVPELSTINTAWPEWARERGYDLYGRGPKVGSDCIETSIKIADAIGLSVQVHETRTSTLLIITKKGA